MPFFLCFVFCFGALFFGLLAFLYSLCFLPIINKILLLSKKAMVVCLLLAHEIKFSLMNWQLPLVDFLSSLSPA
jgi:hypothetical protein